MKKRDIILDFTSLLDVTLIVIFFFVLFSHLDNEENKARTDSKIAEMNDAIYEAEIRESDANELIDELNEELEKASESNKRQGSTMREMISFNRGENIKVILAMKEKDWDIRIIKGDNVVTTIAKGEDITSSIIGALEKAEYDVNGTIFCDFVYDASLDGSNSAYKQIQNAFKEVKDTYRYIYISETDLSVGGES